MTPPDCNRDLPLPALDGGRTARPDEFPVSIDGAAVHVTGVLDASTGSLLLAAIQYLQSQGRTGITVDLTDVQRLESEGIRVLFDRRDAHAGAESIICVSDPVRAAVAHRRRPTRS
jgi:anti-anti-sigma regulatory factor